MSSACKKIGSLLFVGGGCKEVSGQASPSFAGRQLPASPCWKSKIRALKKDCGCEMCEACRGTARYAEG